MTDYEHIPVNIVQRKRGPNSMISTNESLTLDNKQLLKKASEKVKKIITNTKVIRSSEKHVSKKMIPASSSLSKKLTGKNCRTYKN